MYLSLGFPVALVCSGICWVTSLGFPSFCILCTGSIQSHCPITCLSITRCTCLNIYRFKISNTFSDLISVYGNQWAQVSRAVNAAYIGVIYNWSLPLSEPCYLFKNCSKLQYQFYWTLPSRRAYCDMYVVSIGQDIFISVYEYSSTDNCCLYQSINIYEDRVTLGSSIFSGFISFHLCFLEIWFATYAIPNEVLVITVNCSGMNNSLIDCKCIIFIFKHRQSLVANIVYLRLNQMFSLEIVTEWIFGRVLTFSYKYRFQ